MRRAVLFAVALVALVAVPTATAGSFSGVTVAKDAKRQSPIVVSGRTVRTVRAGAGYARVRVRQRIVVRRRSSRTERTAPARFGVPDGLHGFDPAPSS